MEQLFQTRFFNFSQGTVPETALYFLKERDYMEAESKGEI